MKSRQYFLLIALIAAMCLSLIVTSSTTLAQAPIQVDCGETVESVFTSNGQIHQYTIEAQPDMSLILFAETKIGEYERLRVDMGLRAPNNFEIDALVDYHANETDTITTDWLSVDGRYELSIGGWTDTGGAYALVISCLYTDGTVISGNNMVQSLQCGAIVENFLQRNGEIHRYYINLGRDDQVKFFANSLAGNYESLRVDMGLWAPNNFEIDALVDYLANETNTIETAPLSVDGVYTMLLGGWTNAPANYELTVTCTLANGNVINPGDAPPVSLVSNETSTTSAAAPVFSGFGFPGLAPIDFSTVARLPIPEGVPMSGSITPNSEEILGYLVNANEGDTVDLSLTRFSGNLNLGLVVITADNQIMFQASLVASQSLNTTLILPATGEYTVGVFRMNLVPPDNPEPTVFQLNTRINPDG